MKTLAGELAPCGVYCGACPSFGKSCFGCSSKTKVGTRTKSRAGCKIRICCYQEKKLDYCAYCEQFPCGSINKKLVTSHPGDPRYHYRHELPKTGLELREQGSELFIKNQKARWACPACGGIIHFYHYRCAKCGREGSPL